MSNLIVAATTNPAVLAVGTFAIALKFPGLLVAGGRVTAAALHAIRLILPELQALLTDVRANGTATVLYTTLETAAFHTFTGGCSVIKPIGNGLMILITEGTLIPAAWRVENYFNGHLYQEQAQAKQLALLEEELAGTPAVGLDDVQPEILHDATCGATTLQGLPCKKMRKNGHSRCSQHLGR